jgi:hypothetical protein
MMSEFNIWGQTAIMLQKLQQQAKHQRALAVGAMHTVNIIEKCIERLKGERDNLLKAEKALKDVDSLAGRKRDQELGLMAEINALKSDDMIAAAGAAIVAADRARSSSSPFARIPQSTPISSMSSIPSEFVSPSFLTSSAQDGIDEMSDSEQVGDDDEEKIKEELTESEKAKAIKSVLGI